MQTQDEPRLSNKQLLAFFAMIVGMFMAVLDIQIVASSISVIGAGLSASSDELSWVQTSYLIAEVITIPMTGFFARLLSTRITYFIAALGFTVMSLMCSLAWNIESMIIFRSLQGFFGGAMIPTVFSIIFIIFPIRQRGNVNIIIGLVVTIAPTLGPTLGGYITDMFSWHFMFLLNLLPGIFVCVIVFLYADFDKPNYALINNFDYIGVILMIATLGSLQYILEEGNKNGWFEDTNLLILSCVVLCGFVLFIIRELKYINPILDLRAFNNKDFTFGCVYSFLIGIGLYNATYLLPLFLFTIAGFNTVQIGLTMMITGIAQFASAPIAGKMLASSIDLRIMLAIGLSMFGMGCYLDSFLTLDSKFWEFFVPQILRGGALMFCFIPVSNIALGSIQKEHVHNASGLYNLTRNLGGAIGIALVNNTLNSKTKIITQYLSEHITTTSSQANQRLEFMTQMLNGKVTNELEVAQLFLTKIITKNAFIIAINDIFATIGLAFILAIALLPLASNIKTNGPSENTH